MLADILLTIPILLLFLGVAARCLLRAPETVGGYEPERDRIIKVFAWGLGFRVFMLLIMLLCAMLSSGGGGLQGFVGRFARWDARHYINLIERGYSGYQENGRHLFLVFYPLYVWVVRGVRLIIPNTMAAGLLVSSLSYSWGCCYVYRIAAKLLGRRGARDSVMLLSLFPYSFFFGTVMTEGLFLLTTGAACYYALERRWLLYGLWGSLAAMTRMTGVLVAVLGLVEVIGGLGPLERPVGQSLKRMALGLIKKLPALIMPLLGSGVYLFLNWRVDGDPFAFRAHQAHWHQGGMWVSRVLKYIWRYFLENIARANGYAIWLPELLLFALGFIIILLALKKGRARPSLLAYALCYLTATYSLSWLLSAGRYMSCCFPMFILAASLIGDRPALKLGVFTGGALLMGVYLSAYFSGAQVM